MVALSFLTEKRCRSHRFLYNIPFSSYSLFCYILLKQPFSASSPFETPVPPTHSFLFPILVSSQKVHSTSFWFISHSLLFPNAERICSNKEHRQSGCVRRISCAHRLQQTYYCMRKVRIMIRSRGEFAGTAKNCTAPGVYRSTAGTRRGRP